MAPERRTPAGEAGAGETFGRGSASDGSALASPVQVGTRYGYSCPFCGKNANAAYKLDQLGDPEWFVGCWTADCDGRYLPTLAVALGLDAGSPKAQIAAAIRRLGRPASRRDEPLPSAQQLRWWREELWSKHGAEACEWLVRDRLVSLDVVRAAKLGWDRSKARVVFPMYSGSALVGAKWRKLGSGPGIQMRSWAGEGREWPLYPAPKGRSVLLVAGELDALAARSAGLPATSVTLGAGHWEDRWTRELRGRRVVVCFDVNETEQARQRIAALRDAGISARRLDLASLGVDKPKGDVTDYLRAGGDATRLRPRQVTRRQKTAA